MKARIYIVDDELMAIQYLKYIIKEADIDCEVVGDATNGVKAIPEILRLKPDIVFADISMPVMDGLQMAEEVLKKNEKQKIVILTSYRDFDYAKRGMKIGVTDYILKNELSEDYLRSLITKIRQENLKVRKEQHLIVEHNIRNFLLTDTVDIEDHIYEQKPFQRYVIISIIKKPKIFLEISGIQEHCGAECFEIENLAYPEGITCRAVVEMAEGEWCGVFFVDGKISDSVLALKETAKIMEEGFTKYCEDCVYLISNPMNHFLKLHEAYLKQKKLIGYVYAFENREILYAEEISKNITARFSLDACLEELEKQLEQENREEVVNCLKQFMKLSRKSSSFLEYTENIRNIYRYLKKYVLENKIDPKVLKLKDTGMDTDMVEEMFIRFFDKIFEEIEQRKQHQYSYYIISAIDFIQKNYDKDISIPDIAEAVKISEGHLRKCFKQETNKRIVDYLLEYRLNRAKDMMKNGERRIDEIWSNVGFASSQYFSFVFKKNEGMTPSDYIKQINNR